MKVVLCGAVALSVGGALGYWLGGRSGVPEPLEESTATKTAVVRQSDDDAQRRIRELRHRIAELERQLALMKTESKNPVSNPPPQAVAAAPAERPRWNPGEWLENIRKTDPARYTQMTNRFARWRQQRMNQARSRMDFLSSVDTSYMSVSAQETHLALQNLIVQCEELESRLQQPNLPDDERRQIMEELRGSHHEMRRLNSEERRNLLAETVRVLGFSGEDAKEVTTALQDVIRATDSGFGRGHGGFGPPPDGGRRPGNGR